MVVKQKKELKKSVQNRSPSWRAKMHVFTLVTYFNV